MIGRVQVARRDDDVRIDMIAVLDDGGLHFHNYSTSSGIATLPMTADAAATAGEARMTSLPV